MASPDIVGFSYFMLHTTKTLLVLATKVAQFAQPVVQTARWRYKCRIEEFI